MTRKSFIVIVLIISCVYSHLLTSHAAALNQTRFGSIRTELKNNETLCKSQNIFVGSLYTESCDSVDYPTENATLDDKNFKQFLCLGFYDRIGRLCWLDSLTKTGKIVLPENSTVFDAMVKKLLPKNDDNSLKFCESWKNLYPPRIPKIAKFVKEFDEAMKKPTTCIKICNNWRGDLDPLCAVLASMDQISNTTGVKIDDPQEKTYQEGKLTKDLKGNVKEASAPSGPLKGPQIETETSQKSTESKKMEKIPSGPVENVEKSSENSVKTPPSSNKQHKIDVPNVGSQNSPVEGKKLEESTKPKETSVEVSEMSLKNKEEKMKPDLKILEHVEVKNSKDTSEHLKTQADLDLINNGQVDVPDETEIQHNTLAPYTEKNPELSDEKMDVISDHTQEHFDEQFGGGGEPSDDANELGHKTTTRPRIYEQLPIMASPNEDINESPAFPAEKQDVLPRMPGIRNDDDSHFFGYFSVIGVICIAGYVGYHNKQKILAMVLEGRRSRGGRGRRRPSTANYRKLDCTLEEAVTSQCNSNVTHVIY